MNQPTTLHGVIVRVFLGFAVTALLLPHTMATTSPHVAHVANGNAKFASAFYNILSKEEKGNVFFSPLSAHAVLAMVYQGAAGDTAKAFSSTLKLDDKTVAASGYNGVMDVLNNIEKVTLNVANKVYVMKNFPLKDAFKKAIIESFLSETESVNFSDSAATADTINQWVEKKTNSKIKDLISKGDLNGFTRLVLVNAVYFKGNWALKFDKAATKTEPFYVTSKDVIDCQMMHIKKKFNYREDEALDAKVLELQYDNNDVSMVVILPNDKDGIADLESKLANVDITNITHGMRKVEVEVSLPKFKMETSMDLKDILTKMGLGVIFSEDKANFSDISDSPEQLFVSKAIQKAFIEVNEEGAEAAAATAMMMVAMCMPPPPRSFEVDHPFMILLQAGQNSINHILFMGKIVKPSC